MIPKIIWAYWHNEKLPYFYKKCISSWKQYNKDWEINILNDTTLYLYINTFPKYYDGLMQQKKADYIRLYLLKHYGGVWLDVGVMLNKSLEWMIDSNKDNVGYYIKSFSDNNDDTVVENWVIACSENNYIINKWYENFKYIFDNYNNNNFTSSNIYQKTNKQKIKGPDYLFMHVVYQYLLQTDPVFLDHHKKSFLQCAEETALSVQTLLHWNHNNINLFTLLYYFKDNFIRRFISSTLGQCIRFDRILNMTNEQDLVKFRGCDVRTIKHWDTILYYF